MVKAREIAERGSIDELLVMYGFDLGMTNLVILKKFFLFSRINFPQFFSDESAGFHDEMLEGYLNSYRGVWNFANIGFRGCAKTALFKLFLCFVLLNDSGFSKHFVKILSRDLKNSKHLVTDVYNMIRELCWLYGDVFEKKGDKRKRSETMSSFDLVDKGVKVLAGTVGQTQRGHIQMSYRPDWVIFEDVEDSDSIVSGSKTRANIARISEALDGMSTDGSYLVLGNYISDQGVIQWFRNKPAVVFKVYPILDRMGEPTWGVKFDKNKVKMLELNAEDFYGEYMCDPFRSTNKFFDTEMVERDIERAIDCEKESVGFRYWKVYEPDHRYGAGSDHSDGIGKDANALAIFDFTTGELVCSYRNNRISPDLAMNEFMRVCGEYGNCVIAPEVNNKCGGVVITTLRNAGYPRVYKERSEDRGRTIYGWETTGKSKRIMFNRFRQDYKGGMIKIYDVEVLREMKAYSNNNLADESVGLATRHFDLLMAVVIAWQTEKVSEVSNSIESYEEEFLRYVNGG